MNTPIKFTDGNVVGAAAGTAKWSDNFSHLRFSCPCGKGCYVDLPVKPLCPTGWDWDGDKEAPTLSPSIRNFGKNGECWHGHLVKGVFIPC